MGELLDQVMAGGPDLRPLTPQEADFVADLAERPRVYAWQLKEFLVRAVRLAVLDGRLRDTQLLEELLAGIALQRDDEVWARRLLALVGRGPNFFGPTQAECDVVRAAVRYRAEWEREYAAGHPAGVVEFPWVGWRTGPAQRLEALIED